MLAARPAAHTPARSGLTASAAPPATSLQGRPHLRAVGAAAAAAPPARQGQGHAGAQPAPHRQQPTGPQQQGSWQPHAAASTPHRHPRSGVCCRSAAVAGAGGMGDEEPSANIRAAAPVLSFINDLTKWAVSGVVFAVLVWRRDLDVAWGVLGSILASFINKVLKKLINEQRPANARKADPGMPSSHANSLAFLGVYTAVAMSQGAAPASPLGLCAAGLVAISVFLTWLRVRLGYHTVPQVLVGYGLGAATALGWFFWGTRAVLGWLDVHPERRLAVFGATGAAVALFAVRNVWAWYQERKEEKAAKAA